MNWLSLNTLYLFGWFAALLTRNHSVLELEVFALTFQSYKHFQTLI